MRLDIGVFAVKQRVQPLAGKVLPDIDKLATAIIPFPGYPSAYLLVITPPAASRTASETKFSEAIQSSFVC